VSSLFGHDLFVILGFTIPSVAVMALLLLSQGEYQLDLAEDRIVKRERGAQWRNRSRLPAEQNQAQKRSFQIWNQ
jgi:hypothetical protein